ncbi:MAG: response regulator [Candidatus Brocadiaceae bacterium]|nr:response regulator [Candidatus Brocadiaceae bacterium]
MNTKSRILIIEDNETLCNSLKNVLEDDGFTVEIANNGKNAINLSRNNRYDIALVDFELPDISSTEFINNLVSISPSIEFIHITAHASKDNTIESVKQESIIPYELKPLDMDRLLSVLNQVAKRRKAEGEIQKLTHALEFSSTTIVITDEKGRIEYAKPRLAQLTGCSLEEVIGGKTHILNSGKTSPELYKELWKTIKNGSEWKGEFCNREKNGKLYWESASISPVKNDKGVITNFIAVKEDITEQKKMKKALLQTEKLNSLGTITAGISHEFNNILAIIMSNAELLKGGFEDDRELKKRLGDIIKACDDGGVIVKRMRTFSDMEVNHSSYTLTDMGQIIRETIDFTMPRWKNMAQASGVKFHVGTEGLKKTPEIFCNPAELREVFINLINNALDAMLDGGCISFGMTSNRENVFVSVSDTGIGMTDDAKKRVFDPFFSTRKPHGTGLGMSITYGIIKKHGGNIEVESEAGKGTTFNLSIPINNNVVQKATLTGPRPVITNKKLRILVIDDEKKMCMMMNEFFSRSGQIVKTADNGAKAIALARKEDFDLVLCDLAMPEINGYDVIRAINKIDHRPKIGIITGWNEKLTLIEEEGLTVDFVIRKPFNFSELEKQINGSFGSMCRQSEIVASSRNSSTTHP